MRATAVLDARYDEISTVDKPANQFGHIAIAKRAIQEDAVADNEADKIFDAEHNELDWDSLTAGDVVFNEAGAAFEVAEEDEPVRELESVGKSAFFTPSAPTTEVSKSQLETIREELSKAVTEADQVGVLAKAFETVEKRAAEAEKRIAASETIAKSERDLRLTREYIAKADQDYGNLPVPAAELGPILKSLWEAEDEIGALPKGTCAVIKTALTASNALLEQIGKAGGAATTDPLAQVDELLGGDGIAKSLEGDGEISKAKAVTNYFDENPEAYEQYRAARAGR